MNLPAYFFPSTVVLVDDDSELLSLLLEQLNKPPFYRTSTNPEEALAWLSQQEMALLDTREIVHDDDEPNRVVMNLHLLKSLEGLYSAQRFEQVTALVVDHTMPQMTGIELATALQTNPVKKIMLTGEHDKAIAIRAFNTGILQRYLNKEMTVYPELNTAIGELQHAYFTERTHDTMTIIAKYSPHTAAPEFSHLLHKFIRQYHIVEYYCVDISGSFLLLDASGKPYYFAVQSEADISRYEDIAIGNEATDSVITGLKQREQIPVFFTEADHHREVNEWALYPATRLSTTNGLCYYGMVDKLPEGLVDTHRLVSLDTYRHS